MVNIRLDGRNFRFEENLTILDVCKITGVDVPTLCYLENISNEAGCSICVVEVKGAKTLLRACVTKISEGMEIFTDTERVQNARKINLELILAKHPLDCMTCDKDGDCKLQDLAYRFGIKKSRFFEDNFRIKRETSWDSNPFIYFDVEKCILCARCVNTCSKQSCREVISISYRGNNSRVSTPFDVPLEMNHCQFCAECVQNCPVGALIEKPRIGKGKLKDLKITQTICAYCGVGCNVTIYSDKDGKIVRVDGSRSNRINNGRICVKGKFGYEYVNSPERLTKPLVKENGVFREISWEEAIKYTADKLKEIKYRYGPDSIGVLGSSRCTNEDNYVLQKFARAVLGTNNIDNCARLCHASTLVGLGKVFGAGAATNSIDDIKNSDLMFVIGSNMAETHPVIAQIVREHQKFDGAKLIVCDPRYVGLARDADVFIQLIPGSDVVLLNGIMHCILKEGLENREFISNHTEGFGDFSVALEKYTPEYASKITGVPAGDIKKLASIIGKSKAMMVFFTMGITQHTTGVDNVLSIANLALLTGNIGRNGAGVMPLRGQANVQGACDMGVLPDLLPGYQKVDSIDARERFENLWKVKIPDKKGLAVTEFAESAIKGKLKALYIMGENPLMTEADISHVREGFSKLEFIAVQDIFMSETAEIASIVFPASCAYEKDGTFTNTDRHIQLLRKAIKKKEGPRPDWEIISDISTEMGYPMNYKSESEIMDEISRVIPSYAGVSYGRLATSGIQWPCPDKEHPGTGILHRDGVFKTVSKRGIFTPVDYIPAKELPDEEYPFILTTGRILYHYHSGQETRRVETLNKFVPENYVEINFKDAENLNIKDGDAVRVTTRRGSITVKARISDTVKAGVIFIPFHFKESPANLLTILALDERAKIPEFKVCSARVVSL